jgi:hypothetical protein
LPYRSACLSRNRARMLPAAAAVLLGPGLASAQGVDEFGAYGGLEAQGAYESPQSFAFELRIGPYLPNVDREFGSGAGPFEQTFGTDNRYLFGIEIDWQALRIPSLGTLGPGFGWGYTQASAEAFIADEYPARSSEETNLNVMPVYAVGVLRVDVLARDTPVPLVPYGKLGLGAALWWATGPERLSRDDQGVVGEGLSYGWQFALGGMLLLDSLDESSAVEMDNATGVNNSYFFMEWYYSDLGCFGGDCMQVGTNTWMLGLALEI